ncbi:siroheme synthase CysG [Rhizobium sp. S95]|uniref:Siroheme synthase CysG n=1 Tax=Ciceribacter sichuanensis TaxID=2949647 RepID=A0AAJ1BXT5_9HYPH|nr:MULTISPECIES: siroheme synthase CysG [unclassified Ciceribacter]MCM2398205.1 siroheme synthase CysG [Ciceribacter sp. S95]MCO5958210.1 siroheme synthase CysG [Ciceribacter sp. S101]
MPAMPLRLSEPKPTTTARVAPLAKLPVFWSLAGKQTIVAGGSDGAAWKAELLAACGAEVHVYCPNEELGEAMKALIDETAVRSIIHHPHAWHPGIFTGKALALADCETQEEAQAFHDAARAAGVPVNVIDKPDFCQFQFGSIVNRSPVVVAISTDGAAPILAQAIRRRIETLLPPALKSWAELAQALRERANTLLTTPQSRRNFWERFVDRAFAGNRPPEESDGQSLLADAERLAVDQTHGHVTLVGAGPGDAELLTLKAVRALQSADAILFDDLVSAEVLELARREAKRMLVGKRGGRESCRQEDINDTMLALAKAGKRVVRLKSGDPMIFGRAGEEIAFLERHGISCDVVPGITAASAMAASLGVSLTHRDHAQAVRFVTGHARSGDLPADLDWRNLADPKTTTVFYMGGRTAGKIRSRLLDAGMAPDLPVVVASSVTRSSQRSWAGCLNDLERGISEIGYENPVLIGIGPVFQACRRNTDRSDLPAPAHAGRV